MRWQRFDASYRWTSVANEALSVKDLQSESWKVVEGGGSGGRWWEVVKGGGRTTGPLPRARSKRGTIAKDHISTNIVNAAAKPRGRRRDVETTFPAHGAAARSPLQGRWRLALALARGGSQPGDEYHLVLVSEGSECAAGDLSVEAPPQPGDARLLYLRCRFGVAWCRGTGAGIATDALIFVLALALVLRREDDLSRWKKGSVENW